jgi:hypothetical protein
LVLRDPGVPVLCQAHPHSTQANCGISNFLFMGEALTTFGGWDSIDIEVNG